MDVCTKIIPVFWLCLILQKVNAKELSTRLPGLYVKKKKWQNFYCYIKCKKIFVLEMLVDAVLWPAWSNGIFFCNWCCDNLQSQASDQTRIELQCLLLECVWVESSYKYLGRFHRCEGLLDPYPVSHLKQLINLLQEPQQRGRIESSPDLIQ